MNQHVHINGVTVITSALAAILIIGIFNLASMKHQDNSKFWASWGNLYGVH